AWVRSRSDLLHLLLTGEAPVDLSIQRPGRRVAGSIYALVMEGGLHDLERQFEDYTQAALDSLPSDLSARMSNVEIVVEDEPPAGQRLLGLYQGVPLTQRGSNYGGVLPDEIH